ncbi:MAG TPA: exodeoxyribonuclease V subunit alpha [Acidimicrobiales bacterium]|nr:exodeoxyribonuclease V subunit alpha [Acidimicrobiales bacterium]
MSSVPTLGDGVPIDPTDAGDPNLVQGDLCGFELLRPFNQAGVLAAADVHAAIRLARMAGSTDEEVALAAALAVRAPRVGHVSVDLADVRTSVVDADEEVDLDLLPWPDPDGWLRRVAGSDLVAPDSDAADPDPTDPSRPLVLAGRALYLDRYWRAEMAVASEILARLGATPGGAPDARQEDEERLARLFPGAGSADQLRAARLALHSRFTVIAGGPGTGKTTTVARLLAALMEEAEAAGTRAPLVGLAAPTGKAAARMEEAVRAEAERIQASADTRARLAEVGGSTLHRLLGTRFDRPGRFRHHGRHRLPHDVVVVDEASMVSLSLMASLAEAVRPDARLVLVGDPEQLVSVEAGAVLADIVGPAGDATPFPGPSGAREVSGPEAGGGGGGRLGGSIAILRQNHRFTGALATLAEAVRAGRSEEVLAILSSGDPDVAWTEADPGGLVPQGQGGVPGPGGSALSGLHAVTSAWAGAVRLAATAGDSVGAIEALRRHRVLCAHRRGPAGVAVWNRLIEGWAVDSPPSAAGEGMWYTGRPVLVTANDYALRLFNGDTGVAVNAGDEAEPAGRLVVAFDEGRGRPTRAVSPSRLNSVETVFAMTVHKSQGSEFDRVTLLLPAATSRLLTRELLYTAITRAREGVAVMGTEEALRTAVETPIARASGLGRRLWGRPL